MKKTFSFTLLSLMVLMALAGCQGETTPVETPTPTPTPSVTPTPVETEEEETPATMETEETEETQATMETEETQATQATSGSKTEIKTPDDAKNIISGGMAGQSGKTYSIAMALDAACVAQAKMITDAGYKASSITPSPLKTTASWSQTFEGTDMVVLTCTPDLKDKTMTMVTMAKTPKLDVLDN